MVGLGYLNFHFILNCSINNLIPASSYQCVIKIVSGNEKDSAFKRYYFLTKKRIMNWWRYINIRRMSNPVKLTKKLVASRDFNHGPGDNESV